MRTSVLFLALTSLIAPISGLQNIFVGLRYGCGNDAGGDWYVWFTDSPPCNEGTDGGPSQKTGAMLCYKDMTILGHTGIQFSGCAPPRPYYGPPTQVNDNGAQALNCHQLASVEEITCSYPCGRNTIKKTHRCE